MEKAEPKRKKDFKAVQFDNRKRAKSVTVAKQKAASKEVVTQKRALRSTVEITPEQHKATIAVGDAQADRDGGGGLGIPGGRKLADVRKYSPLQFKAKLPDELSGILQTSKRFRADSVPLETQREEVTQTNRRVSFKPKQLGEHSLHVGNDIAAVWNSKAQDKSKVYDYPALIPKVDERITKGSRGEKTYFSDAVSVEDRRKHTAQGMQHLIRGDLDKANASFRSSGATARGEKWIQKVSTIVLAERGREVEGGQAKPDKGALFKALDHVRTGKTFTDVFASPQTKTLAPFALRGGAKTFKSE